MKITIYRKDISGRYVLVDECETNERLFWIVRQHTKEPIKLEFADVGGSMLATAGDWLFEVKDAY